MSWRDGVLAMLVAWNSKGLIAVQEHFKHVDFKSTCESCS